MKQGAEACPVRQVPAAEIERIVIEQIRSLLQTPESHRPDLARCPQGRQGHHREATSAAALLEFEPIWNELFPAEQARIVELLVERVDLHPDGIDLRLRVEGLTSLVQRTARQRRLASGGGMTGTANDAASVSSAARR